MGQAEKARKKAIEYDMEYGGCAQSVLGALQEELDIGTTESFKAASVLAGGIVRHGETCGAIIGALAALGIVIGRERMEDVEINRAAMDSASVLYDRFKQEMNNEFGFKDGLDNTLCRHIQEKIYGRSFDLAIKEEFDAFLEAGGHSDTGCPKVCGIAAQIGVDEILKT